MQACGKNAQLVIYPKNMDMMFSVALGEETIIGIDDNKPFIGGASSEPITIEQKTKEESAADKETLFFEEACQFIKQLQRQEEERVNKLERTSYKMLTGEKNVTASDFDYGKEYHQEEEISLNGSNLFTGMKQEVDIILSAIYQM